MGYIGAAFGTAFLIGPAISGVLSSLGVDVHSIIMMTFVIVALNVVLIWRYLEEPRRHQDVTEVDLTDFHFSRTVVTLLILSFGATLAFSAIQSMSGQFYADRFHFSAAQIGYTMALVGAVSIIYQGWLVKYVRRKLSEVSMLWLAF